MIKNKVLKIISCNKYSICDDCIQINQTFNRIQTNRCCNQLKRVDFITREKRKCGNCEKVKLSSNITLIGSNYLYKLENKNTLSEKSESKHYGEFNIRFKFEWISLKTQVNNNYFFPQNIDKTKSSKHNQPAVYRWILINSNGIKTQNIYIGEAVELAQRIYHYLNPGAEQKTNIRLNSLFHELVAKGNRITIEQLQFEPFKLDNHIINQNSLQDKLTRRFIEHLMATFYSHEGYNVMNK